MEFEGFGKVVHSAVAICLQDACEGAGPQRSGLGRLCSNDFVQRSQARRLIKLAAWDLLVEEMDVFGINALRVALERQERYIFEGRGALHECNATRNLIQVVCLDQLQNRLLPHPVSPLRAELGLRWRPLTIGQTECGCLVGGSGKALLAEGGHAVGSAHGEIGSPVDEPSDLDQVEEDGRVDGPRPRGVVVRIRDGLENLEG